jgi:biofilm PGA synthesis N-glycosyltransferase PgaC
MESTGRPHLSSVSGDEGGGAGGRRSASSVLAPAGELGTLLLDEIESGIALADDPGTAAAGVAPGAGRQRTGRVIVLIPAHNEGPSIGRTLLSLGRQTRLPDEIIVICDNCTDDTAAVSVANGARIIATTGNTHKKAGALNQALDRVLPLACSDDLILAMDADSQLSPAWIQSAVETLETQARVGGVCGTFLGEEGFGLVGQLQRNEYFRYSRHVRRRRQAPVLSGTGTLFRVRALRQLARERGRTLPGSPGEIYNTGTVTEDNEITLALKTAGFACWSGLGCYTLTEVMPTWRDLFRQRLRWQRGALSDLHSYGVTHVTTSYWLKQIMIHLAFLASIGCWLIMGLSMRHFAGFNLPWTAGVVSVTLVERVLTVRKGGIRGILVALLLLPELAYDVFRLTYFGRALYLAALHRDVQWNHVVKNDA